MRPVAIELAFDAASDRRLRRVWAELAAISGTPTTGELGITPHVTLALFRTAAPTADLARVVEALAKRVASFRVDLAAVDRFATREGVVFLRPQPSADLARVHALLQDLLGDDRRRVDADYRPRRWRPHCALALDVAESAAATVVAACASGALGPVEVTRVQLVHYRPAALVAEGQLAATAIVIRRAVESDLDGICEAHRRAIREVCAASYAAAEVDAWTARLYPGIHREAIAAHEFFVAVEAGRVLGFGQLDGATGEVHGCYVHPAALRHGVGTRLLATLEARAVELGLARLHLDASLNAVAFYRQAGFVGAGERRHMLGSGIAIACVHMEKTLRP